MAIEKKSLIGNRAAVKKAVLASNPTKIASSPAVTGKLAAQHMGAKFATVQKGAKFAAVQKGAKFAAAQKGAKFALK